MPDVAALPSCVSASLHLQCKTDRRRLVVRSCPCDVRPPLDSRSSDRLRWMVKILTPFTNTISQTSHEMIKDTHVMHAVQGHILSRSSGPVLTRHRYLSALIQPTRDISWIKLQAHSHTHFDHHSSFQTMIPHSLMSTESPRSRLLTLLLTADGHGRRIVAPPHA